MTEEFLEHVGVGHEDGGHSGRYPWGSGEKEFKDATSFYDRVKKLQKAGFKKSEIAEALGMKNAAELESAFSIAKDESRTRIVDEAKRLNNEGYGATDIGRMLADINDGKVIGESTIRGYFKEDAERNMRMATRTADELQALVDKYGFIDVGKGSELGMNNGLGIKQTKFNKAVDILYMRGYEVHNKIQIPQQTNPGKFTTLKVLCKPGTTFNEAYKAAKENKIKPVLDYAENITNDEGMPSGFIYPKSLNPNRLLVRSAEMGGADKDGLAEIRPGVADLSLGKSHYSQIRILVDGGGGDKDYYIKGMAAYGDPKDFPPGVDIIFNTKKLQKDFDEKGPLKAGLKSVKDNLDKDPTNPFGSAIKAEGGQSYYDDPNGDYFNPVTGTRQSLSLINKRSDEGDWDEWSRKLPSQFLSKQPMTLINRQLGIAIEDKEEEYNEIMSLTNPTVKKRLLTEFASDCDSTATHLHAAALPGQVYKTILPVPSLKDDEIYDPTLPNGSTVVLIRYPHGGIFEIPRLKVNNNNQEGRKFLSTDPQDAVGINPATASILSGADFDGDTVMRIPITEKTHIINKEALDGLKGFDTDSYKSDEPIFVKNGKEYGVRNGKPYAIIAPAYKQRQMGVVSNLITDMTLAGASWDELERAVKHSMVVIDSKKHKLDYRASERENGIEELKKKYQAHLGDERYGGAQTLISRAKSPMIVKERKEGAVFTREGDIRVESAGKDERGHIQYKDPVTGKLYSGNEVHRLPFDPKTGKKVYTETNEVQYKTNKKIGDIKKGAAVFMQKRNGEEVYYYKDKASGEFTILNKDDVDSIFKTMEVPTMDNTKDANELVSVYKTKQELAYANYANKLKALANDARKEAYTLKGIPQNLDAKAKYKEQRDSLEYKYNQAVANKPKERQAQLLAGSRMATLIAEDPYMDPDHKSKLRSNELARARAQVGAKRNPIIVDELEWEAIQLGAIAPSTLDNIIKTIDSDTLKALAMPREQKALTGYKVTRIKRLSDQGYTTAEIAKHFGISESLVKNALYKER